MKNQNKIILNLRILFTICSLIFLTIIILIITNYNTEPKLNSSKITPEIINYNKNIILNFNKFIIQNQNSNFYKNQINLVFNKTNQKPSELYIKAQNATIEFKNIYCTSKLITNTNTKRYEITTLFKNSEIGIITFNCNKEFKINQTYSGIIKLETINPKFNSFDIINGNITLSLN